MPALLLGTVLHPHRTTPGALAALTASAALPAHSLLAVAAIAADSLNRLTALPIAVALQLGPAPDSATLIGSSLWLGRSRRLLLIGTGLHAVVALLLGTATRLLLAPLQPPSRATMPR
jgi:hypothetical protein